MEDDISGSKTVMDVYLTGLRNQHAVETQAIGTVKNELSRMEEYPDLHKRMQQEMDRSTEQAARLDRPLEKYGTKVSLAKEAITGAATAGRGRTPGSHTPRRAIRSLRPFLRRLAQGLRDRLVQNTVDPRRGSRRV